MIVPFTVVGVTNCKLGFASSTGVLGFLFKEASFDKLYMNFQPLFIWPGKSRKLKKSLFFTIVSLYALGDFKILLILLNNDGLSLPV